VRAWFARTGSDAPFWAKMGAVLIIALGSDPNGVLEGRIEGRHLGQSYYGGRVRGVEG
jgi:hypothetical protein